jgi:hypothetical protein
MRRTTWADLGTACDANQLREMFVGLRCRERPDSGRSL